MINEIMFSRKKIVQFDLDWNATIPCVQTSNCELSPIFYAFPENIRNENEKGGLLSCE